MNDTQSHSIRQIAKLIMMMSYCLLTGCMTMAMERLSFIKEDITPVSILSGKNGDIAVNVVSRYSRAGAFDKNETVPLYEPRDRYLIFNSVFIRNCLDNTTHTAEGILSIKRDIFSKHYPDGSTQSWEATITPPGFWDPAVVPGKLPAGFDPVNVRQYELKENIPYRMGNETVYLSFAQLKVDRNRIHVRWWYHYALVPALAGDFVIVVAYYPTLPVWLPVIIAKDILKG